MYEEQLIRKIKGKTAGIKCGSIKPEDSGIGVLFTSLKKMNEPMYDELMNNYKAVMAEINKAK